MAPVLDPEGAHLGSLRRLAGFDGRSVLEVGCGDGRLTAGLAEEAASILAFDADADAVAAARARLAAERAAHVSFRLGSARQIEIPRTQFDIVVFSWSL
ncbi:MAG TPA: methyltransferase domain-containing protein [Gaiellaceae bacterium]|jgi:ubiquinone/menaquinone biosynthesis C-methylase UbiE